MPEITTFSLVEDDDSVLLVQRIFKKALLQLGLQRVADGVQAVEYLQRQGAYSDVLKYPRADVILLDLNLPRMGGFEFLQWLRLSHSNDYNLVPVVIMSISGELRDVKRAYTLGANAYMVKPLDLFQLEEGVKILATYWANHVEKPAFVTANTVSFAS